MEKDEEAAFLAEQATLASSAAVASLIQQAKALLDASDLTFIRCGKAGVPWPAEWQDYVVALRGIVNSGTGNIPEAPAYPQGT